MAEVLVLRIRHIQERDNIAARVIPFAVGNHGDDFHRRVRIKFAPSARDVQANGIASREGSLRQFFVDDADLGALGCIRLVEFPTGDERNAHRRKVIWANVVIHGVGIVSGTIAFGCEVGTRIVARKNFSRGNRSEEHTSELQSLTNLVCRLLLEKKKNQKTQKLTTESHTYQYQNRTTPDTAHQP